MTRWIAHIDMDSFYVSVERIKNPKLIGLPVVVGGLGARSVVASSSYEARKFGVRSAMPMSQARRLCQSLIVVEPDFTAYSTISKKIFSELEKVAPVVEQVSVDEAYLDFTGCERLYPSREASGTRVREVVKDVSGMTCTVAIATNKLVTKIGSDLAKPDGLLVVEAGTEAEFLKPLSIRKIPGIGTKTSLWLEGRGILTCGDLVNWNSSELKRIFGDHALHWQAEARGEDDSEVNPEGERKSLSQEETFEKDVGSLPELFEEIRLMSENIGTGLREENLKTRTISIKIRYEDFTTCVRAHTLPEATQQAKIIAQAARHLLEKNKIPHRKLRLLGVSARNLIHESRVGGSQFDLFENPEKRMKEEKVENLKDELKRRFGEKILV